MLEIVDHLSRRIGGRVAGSEGERKASKYLANKMKEIGLNVAVQRFKFVSWKPTLKPKLDVLEPERLKLNPGLMLFSDNTPKGGVEGRLVYSGIIYIVEGMFEWPKYAVVGKDGAVRGYVIAFPDGPAISMPLTKMGRNFGRAPYLMIGKEDYLKIKNWIDSGKHVRVKMRVEGKLENDLYSHNVIGTLPGTDLPDEEIIVCAHYDCAINSFGADDNASGVETMLRVAKRLIKKGAKKTVKFIAFGAEEPLLSGSSYYANDLKERGLLNSVKALVNLDMTGAGERLTIASEPKSFHEFVCNTIMNSELRDKVRIDINSMKICEDSDHWEFHVNHIPVTTLLYWPYENYHQSSDTADKLSEELVDKTAEATYMLIKNLAFTVD